LHVRLQAQVTIDVEDLEANASPEDLMLSYVSGEKGKVPSCLLSTGRKTVLSNVSASSIRSGSTKHIKLVYLSCP